MSRRRGEPGDDMIIAAWMAEVLADALDYHPPCRLCVTGAAHRLGLAKTTRQRLSAYLYEAIDLEPMASHADPFARSEDAARRYRGDWRPRHRHRCSECDAGDHTAARCPILWERRRKAA